MDSDACSVALFTLDKAVERDSCVVGGRGMCNSNDSEEGDES